MKMNQLGNADYLYPSSGRSRVEVWETIDSRRFGVSEWNGEKWLECWEIFPDMSTGPSFEASPVYRWEADGMTPDEVLCLEENSPEWICAHEIVGLDF